METESQPVGTRYQNNDNTRRRVSTTTQTPGMEEVEGTRTQAPGMGGGLEGWGFEDPRSDPGEWWNGREPGMEAIIQTAGLCRRNEDPMIQVQEEWRSDPRRSVSAPTLLQADPYAPTHTSQPIRPDPYDPTNTTRPIRPWPIRPRPIRPRPIRPRPARPLPHRPPPYTGGGGGWISTGYSFPTFIAVYFIFETRKMWTMETALLSSIREMEKEFKAVVPPWTAMMAMTSTDREKEKHFKEVVFLWTANTAMVSTDREIETARFE